MNLKELLKIDTTKTNWYKVFDKHGINPKTIDAVSKGGGGGDNSGFKYESTKVIYQIDFSKDKEMTCGLLQYLTIIPIYATYSTYISKGSGNQRLYNKFYGVGASFLIGTSSLLPYLTNDFIESINIDSIILAYIEEAKGPYIIKTKDLNVTINNILELFEIILGITGQELINTLESLGIKQVPYVDFSDNIDQEFGNFLE